ncbi:MAG: hypothetical protein IKK04_02440 [Bacteroidales bacterium]|nr:hypothetical protein [Bacteroidales bacterium]
MSSIFAPFYELFFFDPNYQLIFDQLYAGPGYFWMGFLLTLFPVALLIPFYWDYKFPFRNPYYGVKIWIVWLIVSAFIISILTYLFAFQFIFNTSNEDLNIALNDPNLQYEEYAKYLIWMYTLLNGFGSLLISFIHSLWMKQCSKLHIHIPF